MTANNNTLLIEFLCEELPPSSQKKIADTFAAKIFDQLKTAKFTDNSAKLTIFSTPRRFGVAISSALNQSPSEELEIKLMPKKIGWGSDEKPTKPLLKKLESLNLSGSANSLSNFVIKDEILFIKTNSDGKSLAEYLQNTVPLIIKDLPIAKLMSYQLDDGWNTVSFARPVKNILCLHGNSHINLNILGLSSNKFTLGHRFESKEEKIEINNASEYQKQLFEEGNVIAQFDSRKKIILEQIDNITKSLTKGSHCPIDEDLLNEVTTLVEKPNALVGSFDEKFLHIPSECLVLSMKSNQKYFPIMKDERLTNQFIIISNISPNDDKLIIEGNEKVIYPRLADAEFFYEQDKKKTLSLMVEDLKNITYHQKLGSLEDRCNRVTQIFDYLLSNSSLKTNENSSKLALMSKADLSSLMVGEFPELQGVMGKYYAKDEGLSLSFAEAIEDHYKPKFSGDSLPGNDTSILLALSDKFTTLIDLFSVGEKPSGVKDPFALRRCAISIIRILIEKEIDLNFIKLIDNFFPKEKKQDKDDLYAFIFDRLENFIRDKGFETLEVQSVCEDRPSILSDILIKVNAISKFKNNSKSQSLAQSNKRVINILKKYDQELSDEINVNIFENTFEKDLYFAIENVDKLNQDYLEKKNYEELLMNLESLSEPIDQFFESTMINSDNEKVKHNRHLLLSRLNKSMNIIANLSVLGT